MSDDVHRDLVAERVAAQRSRLAKRPTTSTTPPPAATVAAKRAAVPRRVSQPLSGVENQFAMVPCRYFVAGGVCPAGSKCRFSHHPALLGMTALLEGDAGDAYSSGAYTRIRAGEEEEEQTALSAGPAPDVDSMSYEQLLNLCEQVGKVKVGVPQPSLQRIPVITVMHESADHCSVCLEPFAVGSKMRMLPCGHPFHLHCIDEWLEGSKKCPNCNKDVTEGLVSVGDVLQSITAEDGEAAGGGATDSAFPIAPPAIVVRSPAPKRSPPKPAKPVWRF